MIDQHLLQLDSENRQRALELTSFIVEAPAGAGKTELLTQRYLKLLTVVNEPEEIIAITFTNKAASEMRGRVMSSLQDAIDAIPVELEHKKVTRQLALAALSRSTEKEWDLIAQPARLRINTIDSLSGSLARQMPLLSRFGSQPAVVDDALPLYLEAAKRCVAMLESETSIDAPIHTALRYFDNDMSRLSGQLADMLAKRDQWMHHANQSAQVESLEAFRVLIEKDLQAIALTLPASMQQRLMPIVRYAASHLPCEHCVSLLLDWESPIPVTLEALPMWQSLVDVLLTRDGQLRKERGINIKNGFPATEEAKTYKQALLDVMADITDVSSIARARELPTLSDAQNDWHIVEALSQVLKLAAAHLLTVFQEAGEVDFVEVSQRALTALGDDVNPTDLALALDYRIQHLLVDEFQDTSPSQIALLERLTMGWQPHDGRTLFCVGDPMQSIYRFRKADVGLFLDVTASGIGSLTLDRLQLTRNNRSCPAVIDWINQAFAHVFPGLDSVTRGAISYRPFAASKLGLMGDGVVTHALIAPVDADAVLLAAHEAEHIVQLIDQERTQYPDRKLAVLVRARTHLQALVLALRRNKPNLHFQAVEIESLADRQAVQDVFALTHALLHRADRVNWLAILRAPWCGLLLSDLHALVADDHQSTVWQLIQDEARTVRLSHDGKKRLDHLKSVISEAFAWQGRQSLRQWIESVWLKLGGPQALWDAGDVRDVQAFFDLVEKLDGAERFSLNLLQEEMERLYAAPDVHADDRLQFMTIHKSKGLEFDTVIMPSLHRQPNKQDSPLVLWEELLVDGLNPKLAAAAWQPKHQRGDEISAYDFLQGLESERAKNEAARVLYVGVTRAIHRLHLVGVLKTSDDIKPPSSTFIEMLWPTVGTYFLEAANQKAGSVPMHAVVNDSATFIPKLIRLADPVVPQALHAANASESPLYQQDVAASANTLEASIGSLIHLYMEILAQQDINEWTIARLQNLAPAMRMWLENAGHTLSEANAGAAQVINVLQTTLQSESGRWILKQREQHAAELSISNHDQQKYNNHVIDRTFIDQDERWIIDYKSALAVTDTQPENLKILAEQYQTQLDRYAALFDDKNLPIRKAIFFLRTGQLVELD